MELRKILAGSVSIMDTVLILIIVMVSVEATSPPSDATSPIPLSGSTVKFDMHSCVAHPDGIYADPFDCHRYYHCVRQKTFYFRCFDGFVFDPCRHRCIYQKDCIKSTEPCSSSTPGPIPALDPDVAKNIVSNNQDQNAKNVSRLVVDRLGKNESSSGEPVDEKGKTENQEGTSPEPIEGHNVRTSPEPKEGREGTSAPVEGHREASSPEGHGRRRGTTPEPEAEPNAPHREGTPVAHGEGTSPKPESGTHEGTSPDESGVHGEGTSPEPSGAHATKPHDHGEESDEGKATGEPIEHSHGEEGNGTQPGSTPSSHRGTKPPPEGHEGGGAAVEESPENGKNASEPTGHGEPRNGTTESVEGEGESPKATSPSRGGEYGQSLTTEIPGEQGGRGESEPGITPASSHRGQTYLVRVIFNRRIFAEPANGTDVTRAPTRANPGHVTTPKPRSAEKPPESENSTKIEPGEEKSAKPESGEKPETRKSPGSKEMEPEKNTTSPKIDEENHKPKNNETKEENHGEEPKENKSEENGNSTRLDHSHDEVTTPPSHKNSSGEKEDHSHAEEENPGKPKEKVENPGKSKEKAGNPGKSHENPENSEKPDNSTKSAEKSNSSTPHAKNSKEIPQPHKNKTEVLALQAETNKCTENGHAHSNDSKPPHQARGNESEPRGDEEVKDDSVPARKDQKKLLQSIKNEFAPPLNFRFVAGQSVASKLGDLLGELNITAVCRSPPLVPTECQCPSSDSDNLSSTDHNQSIQSRCRSLTCFNGAMYIELSNGQCGCLCPVGYRGDRCQHLVNHTSCHCANGGRCISVGNGTFACLCPLGYLGGQCQYPFPSSAASNDAKVQLCESEQNEKKCQNGGICLKNGLQEQCYCPTGVSGDLCQNKK